MTSYKVHLSMQCKRCGHFGQRLYHTITRGVTKGVGCKSCGNKRDFTKYGEMEVGDIDSWPSSQYYSMALEIVVVEKL